MFCHTPLGTWSQEAQILVLPLLLLSRMKKKNLEGLELKISYPISGKPCSEQMLGEKKPREFNMIERHL